MNKRLFLRLACSATACPLLMLLAYEMDGTRLEWVAAPFSAPGLWFANLLYSGGIHSGQGEQYLQVAFLLNFAFIWIALLVALRFAERFLARRMRSAAN